MIVVPAAISWACGPNRAIQLSSYEVAPGSSVTLTGGNFYPDIDITIKVNGEVAGSGHTTSTGNLSAVFKAPTAPGTYSVHTDGIDPDTGQSLAGTGTPQSLVVKAPAPAPTTGGGGGSTPSTGNGAPSPGTTTGSQPGSSGQTGSNRTSGREPSRSGTRQRSTSGTDRGTSGTRAEGSVGANTTEGVIRSAGRTAFAGSVPRKDRAAAAKAKAKGKVKAATGSVAEVRPTQGTATSDLWSGFASSKNPSLMPGAGDSGVPTAGTSTGVKAGLALLGIGLVAALGLGGLAVAARRRERAAG